jgi:hypothetical protein
MSVFDDRQLIMGFPGTMVGGLRRMQNSTVQRRQFILVWSARIASLHPIWVKNILHPALGVWTVRSVPFPI